MFGGVINKPNKGRPKQKTSRDEADEGPAGTLLPCRPAIRSSPHTCGIHRLQESSSGVNNSDATAEAVETVDAVDGVDGGGDYASDEGNENNAVLGYPN